MARKKLEDMEKAELESLLKWMENRIRYIRFLLADKFN